MRNRPDMFSSLGRTIDESMSMMADLSSGRMSRAEFDRWYEQRRRESMDMAFRLRDRTAGLREPMQLLFDIGRSFVAGPSAGRRRRSRRRGGRASPAESAARSATRVARAAARPAGGRRARR